MRTSHRIDFPPLALVGRLGAGCLMLLVAGCSGDEAVRTFGLVRDAPDEFQVTTRAPLSMPPDFQIRPPRPGAPRPQEQSASSAGEAALVPQAALTGGGRGRPSPGQSALVAAAGPSAPADIRTKIEEDASLDQPDRTLTDRLMFWRSPGQPGIVVDASKESKRLRGNAALGQNLDQGDTPIIQRTPPGKGGLFSLF